VHHHGGGRPPRRAATKANSAATKIAVAKINPTTASNPTTVATNLLPHPDRGGYSHRYPPTRYTSATGVHYD
jgi:hypothetical protein